MPHLTKSWGLLSGANLNLETCSKLYLIRKDADALYISLPVNEAGNPDYDKMAIIISAIHKLVIKDVVAYSNRKIKATKAVVK